MTGSRASPWNTSQFSGEWEISELWTPTENATVSNTTDLLSKEMTPTGYAIAAACLVFIFIFGCTNNLVVILVFLRSRKLRTPMNLILLNLSISDLIISALGTPLSFVSAVCHRWILGNMVCQIYAFFMTLTGMAGIGTLVAIAVERYIIISRPFRCSTLTPTYAGVTILVIWMYSLAQALPPLFGWNEYVIENPGIACSVNWQSSSHSSYIFFIFSIGYVIPLLVMTFCYGRVVWIIKRYPRMKGKSSTAKAENRVTLMSFVMIICTMVAWTPYAVVSLMVSLGYDHLIGPIASGVPAIFAKTSVIYNPIVYFFLNTQIREAIFATMPSCLHLSRTAALQEGISLETNPRFWVMNDTVISNPSPALPLGRASETGVDQELPINEPFVSLSDLTSDP